MKQMRILNFNRIVLAGILIMASATLQAQFLSNLSATSADAIYTTYTAPPERSQYKADQGYHLNWDDPESGVEFVSRDGLNLGLGISSKGQTCFQLKDYFSEPVLSVSYSDLARFSFYPFKDIRVDVTFDVFTSGMCIEEFQITNEGHYSMSLDLQPYVYYPSHDSIQDIRHAVPYGFYYFPLEKKKDGWMIDHNIPFAEHLNGYAAIDLPSDSIHSFSATRTFLQQKRSSSPFDPLKRMFLRQKKDSPSIKGLIFARSLRLHPGDRTRFRMIAGIEEQDKSVRDIRNNILAGLDVNLEKCRQEDEKTYSGIPVPGSLNRDQMHFYYSCFSLLRQCMMPPEGKCSFNYYVFSREPKWGWGYGGQVFHESLSMMAYAYMDPRGAMNSQRVYFERQHPDGYINYRTGPYLDETIETKGSLTTSAPWFNYENLEIYKITKDRKFLSEAYDHGKRFYNYFIAKRDSNRNGLCEWGGDGELESVRDARVAVWDKVGPPYEFEGIDLNSMLVKEARSLAEMARLLGKQEEATRWTADAQKRSSLINRTMWDPETGFYYNVNRKDQTFTYKTKNDLKIKEIIGFLPLWAGIASKDQAARLVKSLTNPDEFWRPNGVPTLSAADSYYNPMGYWNGPVWIQWDYLLYRGLLDYGYKTEADELARRVTGNMTEMLKKDHVFWEFYSPDDLRAGWNQAYIWAGLAARFLMKP